MFMIYMCSYRCSEYGPVKDHWQTKKKAELKARRTPSPYWIKQSLCWAKTVKYITCCETST